MVRGTLTFISGGVRSGKSTYAERLLTEEQKEGKRLLYIASGTRTDAEMTGRIEKHQRDRAHYQWKTIEQPINFGEVVPFIQCGDYILWDCMTTWLANELYVGWETGRPCIGQPNCMERKEVALMASLQQILAKATHLVIVSNEVFHDVPSKYDETETYRKWLGHLHQKVVAMADIAIEMESGIPIYWKGEKAL